MKVVDKVLKQIQIIYYNVSAPTKIITGLTNNALLKNVKVITRSETLINSVLHVHKIVLQIKK